MVGSPREFCLRETWMRTVTLWPAWRCPEDGLTSSGPSLLACQVTGPPSARSSTEPSEPPARSRKSGETLSAPVAAGPDGSSEETSAEDGAGKAVGGAEDTRAPSGNVADTGAASRFP